MTKPKEEKIKEEFEKKLKKMLDEAHLLGKQSWEGDKVDNLEIEEFYSWFEQKLKEQRTQLLKEIKRLVNKGNDWDSVIEELLNK